MAAVLLVIFEHRRTKKTMDMLTQMIDTAMDGTFTEDVFDESRMSALATKFAAELESEIPVCKINFRFSISLARLNSTPLRFHI